MAIATLPVPPVFEAAAQPRDDDLDLPAMEDRYDTLEVIGSGVYGTVLKAVDKETTDVVAIKMLKLSERDDFTDGIPAHVVREVGLLRDFQHENIVRLLDFQMTSFTNCNLVFEFVEQDLYRVMKVHRKAGTQVPMSDVVSYSRQLLKGMHACHQIMILHRDLKPQNVLIHADGRLKICDFGLARAFTMPLGAYTNEVVTLWYRAPEIFLGCAKYGTEIDVWSAGCIIAELATGIPTFPGDSEIGMLFKIFRALGTPTDETWPGHRELFHYSPNFPQWPETDMEFFLEQRPELGESGLDLLQNLLALCPPARLTARRASLHQWLAQ
jgi:cyclin-dependent kinase